MSSIHLIPETRLSTKQNTVAKYEKILPHQIYPPISLPHQIHRLDSYKSFLILTYLVFSERKKLYSKKSQRSTFSKYSPVKISTNTLWICVISCHCKPCQWYHFHSVINIYPSDILWLKVAFSSSTEILCTVLPNDDFNNKDFD